MSIFKFDGQPILNAFQSPFMPIQHIVAFFLDKNPAFRHTLLSKCKFLSMELVMVGIDEETGAINAESQEHWQVN